MMHISAHHDPMSISSVCLYLLIPVSFTSIWFCLPWLHICSMMQSLTVTSSLHACAEGNFSIPTLSSDTPFVYSVNLMSPHCSNPECSCSSLHMAGLPGSLTTLWAVVLCGDPLPVHLGPRILVTVILWPP